MTISNFIDKVGLQWLQLSMFEHVISVTSAGWIIRIEILKANDYWKPDMKSYYIDAFTFKLV